MRSVAVRFSGIHDIGMHNLGFVVKIVSRLLLLYFLLAVSMTAFGSVHSTAARDRFFLHLSDPNPAPISNQTPLLLT